MPYLVRENLYIGNVEDASHILQHGSNDISHILSVLSSESLSFFTEWRSELSFPSKEIKRTVCGGLGIDGVEGKGLGVLEYAGKELKVVRMGVALRDMEEENLLECLDGCLEFIEKSRLEGGSVLVHCFAGVSRSAAIVAAFLMRSEHLSLEDALESLRKSCKLVCPNNGFLNQLKMFEQMEFKVDHFSPIYKCFLLKLLGDSYQRGEEINSSKFGEDPGLHREVCSKVKALPNLRRNCISYRCKKCRRLVASHGNIISHTPGEGETSFNWHKRKGGNPFRKSEESECSSVFVEPLKWMKTAEEGAAEGKLNCAHCKARLGHFSWYGMQCSCGSWITPAFQLQKSQVDISFV